MTRSPDFEADYRVQEPYEDVDWWIYADAVGTARFWRDEAIRLAHKLPADAWAKGLVRLENGEEA